MSTRDSMDQPKKTPRYKRILGYLLGIALLVLFAGFAALAVTLGDFASRESGGVRGFGIIATAVIGGAFFLVFFLAVPMAALQGPALCGVYAFHQPLIIIAVCATTGLILAGRRTRRSAWFGTLAFVYCLATLTTNCFVREVDHTREFPLGKAISELNAQQGITETEVVARFGSPTAVKEFHVGDSALPFGHPDSFMWRSVSEQRIDRILIVVYTERETYNPEEAYYLLFRPDDFRFITTARYEAQRIHRYWPFTDAPN